MIVYIIEGYDITGSSSVYGSKVFPTQERATEYVATLNTLFSNIEFIIQEFELDGTSFQNAMENVQ